jgi:hypothetical protein
MIIQLVPEAATTVRLRRIPGGISARSPSQCSHAKNVIVSTPDRVKRRMMRQFFHG